MNIDELIDDEPELVLEDEQGVELSVNLIDDVEMSGEDHDLPDLEELTAVATVKSVPDIPDLSFESENEQTRLACELDGNAAELEFDYEDSAGQPPTLAEDYDKLNERSIDLELTQEQSEPLTTPQLTNDENSLDDMDSLSFSNLTLASSNDKNLDNTKKPQTVSVLPTDNTRLALLESAQLALNEQINELVTVIKQQQYDETSPTQTPSKQFSTAIYYAKYENNYYLAAKWFRKAALRGHAKAQFYLGMLFCKGDGVPRSLFHAYSWFSLAACQNLEEAVQARKKLEPALTSIEIQQSLKLAATRFDQIADLS